MPLFDFFKKTNKKEPSKGGINGIEKKPDQEKLFLSPEQQQNRYEAAMEFLKVFQERIPLVNGKPHAGTVISVPARLAGTSLFRSINKGDFAPGAVILSEEVNTAYPKLLNMFAYYCKQNGIDVMARPVVTEFPEQDKPLLELEQVQVEYQDQYNEIMKKHGLNDLEGAWAGMIVCSIVFNYHCIANKDIDPYVATGIVAMGVVDGAKSSPVPLKTGKPPVKSVSNEKGDQATELIKTIANSSIAGSGTRLVFGERDKAIKEAQDNGGKFVLVHPQVENQLKQGNIDPYVVYVTALIVEMEAKIPKLDFAGGDVDALTQEWSGKPEESVPVHVRQILWLKENAEKFRYQRSGNSWKLK